MKLSVLMLLVLAAVISATKPELDKAIRRQLSELREQQQKWQNSLQSASGYVLDSGLLGSYFLSKDESTYRKLCSPKEEDTSSEEHRHLSGEDEASRPPKNMRPHLFGEDQASRPPKNMQPHRFGEDDASRPPKNMRPRRNVPLFGTDDASLPPTSQPASLSVKRIFALLKSLLTMHRCSLNIMYHKALGHPVSLSVFSCENLRAAGKLIAMPRVALIPVKRHLEMCSKSVPLMHIKRTMQQQVTALGNLFPVKSTGAKKVAAPAWKGMIIGDNPAVYGAVTATTGEDSDSASDDQHHHGKHHHGRHGHHANGTKHQTQGSKFMHFWHESSRKVCDFLRKHQWVVPTGFGLSMFLLILSVAVVVRRRRRRAAALTADDRHALLVSEPKKVALPESEQAGFFINEQ